MCGIAGQFVFDGRPSSSVLTAMNRGNGHRGPDDSSVHVDGNVGLAHRRLSIIDPEKGQQPIFNEDESVAVVFNGEIYNHEAIRRTLEAEGHVFTTDADTEVLVHLYERDGVEFVESLEGMFAFALWDADEERLVLARDPMGIKPLVVAQSTDGVCFSSELRSLIEAGVDHGGLDRDALGTYFAFGYIPAPQTAFENVTKLEPGELAIVTSDGVRRSRYYSPRFDARTPSRETAARELRSLVEDAVRKRLMSDVPLGAFLSGGIDSSIVVGVMSALTDDPVDTFTLGFDQHLYDETWAAREVAEFNGTNHRSFTLTVDELKRMIPDVLDRLGEPFADPSLLPTYMVSQQTSEHVTVALSGDGADELFAGYDKYRVESLGQYYRKLPSSLREYAIEPAVNGLSASRESRLGSLAYKGQWFVNRSTAGAISDRHFDLMRVFDNDVTAVYDDVDPTGVGTQALSERHGSLPPSVRSRDDLTRIQTVDTFYSLPNQMLHKVDLASMYNSLEVRVPFLDTAVVEYAISLPVEYKIDSRDRKRILKTAFGDVLPESILSRSKHGFDMPIGTWFGGELADEFRSVVTDVDLGVLDNRAVLDAHAEHVRGRRDHSRFLWSVFVFKYWARQLQEEGIL